jgi:3-isopropylmalate/(R)-2-methylmalate dehydratase large subunit
MGSTLAEKILAAHCGREKVKPGDFVNVKVDFIIGNEASSLLCIQEFEEIGADRVFDKDRIALFLDHLSPNKDVLAAETCKTVREFCRKYDLTHFYEVGHMGISHVMVPERGLVGAGDVAIGGDSHTCTYGALGAFFHRRRKHGYAQRHYTGRTVDESPADHPHHISRQAAERRERKGFNPVYHRKDRD